MVDHGLMKGAIFIPWNKRIDVLTSANLYLEHVYKQFSLPDKIISHWDPRFASQLFQEIGRLLGVILAMSAAYHPQTDGKTKWMNQELKTYLRIYCSDHLNPGTTFSQLQNLCITTEHTALKNNSCFTSWWAINPLLYQLLTPNLMSLLWNKESPPYNAPVMKPLPLMN